MSFCEKLHYLLLTAPNDGLGDFVNSPKLLETYVTKTPVVK